MILEVFPSGPLATNAIFLGCERTKKAAVIDAPLGITETILERAQKLSLSIEMILLTHSHWDHIADIAELKQKTKAPIYIHPEDKENLMHPGSDKLPLFFSIEGTVPDRELHDNQQLLLGELELKVIHTPGHTPGCVCFYLEKEGVLISGDTLFKGSMGNISFPSSCPQLMWESLKKLAKLPSKTKVYPGHGPMTTIGHESWMTDAEKLLG